MPLWGNPYLKNPFISIWFNAKFHHVREMYEENGTLISKEELENVIGKKALLVKTMLSVLLSLGNGTQTWMPYKDILLNGL